MGLGQYRSEYEAFGSDNYRFRGRIADEYLAIIEVLFARKSRVSFAGKFRSISEAGFYPKPSGGKHPTIWIGGNSAAAAQRAHRFGTGWIVGPSVAPSQIATLLASAGRDAGRDERKGTLHAVLSASIGGPTSEDLWAQSEGKIHRHASRIVGSPGDVAAQLNDYVDCGVSDFMLSFPSDNLGMLHANMAWFAEKYGRC